MTANRSRQDTARWRCCLLAATLIWAALIGLTVATPQALAGDTAMKDCEQEDSSPLAIRACTNVLQGEGLAPEVRARLLTRRGNAWIIEEDNEEAVADFTRALELDKAHIRALRGRARAFTLLDKHEEAAGDWGRIIALDPESATNYLKRAESWLAAGNTSAAMADYDKVAALDPRSIEAHIGRGNVYVALDERANALSAFDRAHAIDPGNFAPDLARAEAAERWGDTKMAIENYSKVLGFRGTVWKARQSLKRLGVDTPP